MLLPRSTTLVACGVATLVLAVAIHAQANDEPSPVERSVTPVADAEEPTATDDPSHDETETGGETEPMAEPETEPSPAPEPSGDVNSAPTVVRDDDAEPNGKPSLAVMPLKNVGVSDVRAGMLDELILSAIHRVGRHAVIGASDIRAMLGVEQTRQAMGCDDESCVAEIAGALAVDLIVAGQVTKLGDRLVITLKLIDQVGVQTLERSEITLADNDDDFPDGAERAVGMMFEPEALALRLGDTAADERSFHHTLGWIGAAGAAAFLGAGIALIAARTDPNVSYQEYRVATDPNDAAAKYADVEQAIGQHNAMVGAGWAMLVIAAAGAGFSLFEFATAPSSEVDASVGVAFFGGPDGPVVTMGGRF